MKENTDFRGWALARCWIAGIAVLAAAGCATLPEPMRANLSARSQEISRCTAWYRALDERIDRAGVRDGGEFRPPGFPYLRTDRFTASFRGIAQESDEKLAAWVDRMNRIDADARAFEIRNLPDEALAAIGGDRAGAIEHARDCGASLLAHDMASPERRKLLVERAQVPDDYVTWQRVVGLYDLTSLAFARGVQGWQKEAAELVRKSAAGELPFATSVIFSPPPSSAATQVPGILAAAPRDAIGIPQLAQQDLDALFAAYAPVIEVEATGAFDRIGALSWSDRQAPEVDAARPTVYRKLAFTRQGGQTLVQLVYVAWFSERPSRNASDMLAGKLDGLVWRVTLDRRGEPLVYDTIHPCGCYQMFFPSEGIEPVPPPPGQVEWAFVPGIAPEGRLKVRLQTRTHYVAGLAADDAKPGQEYAFADYDGLRALALAAGATRSLFGQDGLVAGTERGERVFFWPMGVPSAGAMRQWGRHATAFVGRRHFDDADLIERRFRLPER